MKVAQVNFNVSSNGDFILKVQNPLVCEVQKNPVLRIKKDDLMIYGGIVENHGDESNELKSFI